MISTLLSHSCFIDRCCVCGIAVLPRDGARAISVCPFQPGPPGTVMRLRAWPTGSGIWSIQRSLKNVLSTLTPVRTWKHSRLVLQTGPCTCGFLGVTCPQNKPLLPVSGKETGLSSKQNKNRIGRIQRGELWGGKYHGKVLKVLGVKGRGSSRTASWHGPWDSA